MTEEYMQRLVDYVIDQLEAGASADAIEQALLQTGYDLPTIDAVFDEVDQIYAAAAAPEPEKSPFQEAVQRHDQQGASALDGFWLWATRVRLFKGRLNRSSFLIANVVLFVLYMVSAFLLVLPLLEQGMGADGESLQAYDTLYSLFIGWPLVVLTLSAWSRRLHDLGLTGWLCLVLFAPVANILFFFYLSFKRGDKTANQHGQDGRARNFLGLLGLDLDEAK